MRGNSLSNYLAEKASAGSQVAVCGNIAMVRITPGRAILQGFVERTRGLFFSDIPAYH
jgi:hypothetical protein